MLNIRPRFCAQNFVSLKHGGSTYLLTFVGPVISEKTIILILIFMSQAATVSKISSVLTFSHVKANVSKIDLAEK